MKTTSSLAQATALRPASRQSRYPARSGIPCAERYAVRCTTAIIRVLTTATVVAGGLLWHQPVTAATPEAAVVHTAPGTPNHSSAALVPPAISRTIAGAQLVLIISGKAYALAPATTPRDTTPAAPLTLSAALRAAITHHPSIAAADAAVDRAAAGLGEASAGRLPGLALDGSFLHFGAPMVTAPLHGFNPAAPPAFDRTLMQGGISLGYTIYDGGARGARVARAEALTGAGEAGVATARQTLLGDVVRGYLRVLTTAEVLEANEKRVRALEEERSRAAQLLERGTAARVLVLRAEAAVGAARADWHAARGELDLVLGELARLTGLDPAWISPAALAPVRLAEGVAPGIPEYATPQADSDGASAPTPIQLAGANSNPAAHPRTLVGPQSATPPGTATPAAASPHAPPPPPTATPSPTASRRPLDRAALLARALAANPEITRLQRLQAAAEATRAEARSLWFPTIQAVGRYGEYASALGREQGEWQGGLQLSFPLFTGGARQAAGARADAEIRSARAQLALARLTIAAALDRALAAVETEQARAEALRAATIQAEEVVRIERLALDAGAGVQTDYLAAEAELLRIRAAWSAARAAELAARVELARITGELSIEWLEQNLESGS